MIKSLDTFFYLKLGHKKKAAARGQNNAAKIVSIVCIGPRKRTVECTNTGTAPTVITTKANVNAADYDQHDLGYIPQDAPTQTPH
jgi:hypothetical protein